VDVSPQDERRIRELPSALAAGARIAERLASATPAVFLDYDGTLTSIVDDPAAAVLPPATRRSIERLAVRVPVAVVSGRDLRDVKALVGVEGIHYAGSHGFEVLAPDGTLHRQGEAYLPALARGAEALERRIAGDSGAWIERKTFAIAVHYRVREDPGVGTRIERAVDEVVAGEPRLRKTGGKRIFELRPALAWDKGTAVLSILAMLTRSAREDFVPIYVGDDVTDEDAFRALRGVGLGVVVEGEEDRGTWADYSLPDPDAVRHFLDTLAELARGA